MMCNNQAERGNHTVVISKEVMKVVAEQTFEIATRDVVESDCSAKKMKNLTSNIMRDVSEQANPQLMLTIAKRVESWKHDGSITWKKGVKSFARLYENIRQIYVGQCDGSTELVIVVNDVLLDEVLGYNEFCFELLEDFEDIANFYIFDEEEFESMSVEYSEYNKLYQRGL